MRPIMRHLLCLLHLHRMIPRLGLGFPATVCARPGCGHLVLR